MALENDTLAPDFELQNQFGEPITLSDYRDLRPVTLVFVPMAFSNTCTSEVCSLRDNFESFKQHDNELLVVSVDTKFTLRAWAEADNLDFNLLSDFWPHGEVAKQYGVFLKDRGVANRATFWINKDGTIKDSYITSISEAREFEPYEHAMDALAEPDA